MDCIPAPQPHMLSINGNVLISINSSYVFLWCNHIPFVIDFCVFDFHKISLAMAFYSCVFFFTFLESKGPYMFSLFKNLARDTFFFEIFSFHTQGYIFIWPPMCYVDRCQCTKIDMREAIGHRTSGIK